MIDLKIENEFFECGHQVVAGVDEAGRGPLAGPVVAACFVISKEDVIDRDIIEKANDSKKLSLKKRKYLFDAITQNLKNYSIGVCDHLEIDRLNILSASLLAMRKAVMGLERKIDLVLVDGNQAIKELPFSQKVIVGGDGKVLSIALASILAKVTRDIIMEEMHLRYPNYSFDKHKGYGTKLHLERLKIFGPCEIHRKSFAPIKSLII